ncbi:putative glycolipid-binding domain-containing protein [Saccharomonospora sp. NPDC046836]|uniref:putative glycolipid-binding domain-containing protein n=1 Tax=Saccharomonospora sp. NPDC046836 TaxID=3156921 RepID=UPI0033C8D42A
MPFATPPASAAWTHVTARAGFEVSYFRVSADGCHIDGCTTAVEDGLPWIVAYHIVVDSGWRTRAARITGRTAAGERTTVLESDGAGHWRIDGAAAPELDGCLDVDLESSAMTNTFPVHRLDLPLAARAAAPAAYVRANDLSVQRLEQDYQRVGTEDAQQYDYASPAFDFACRLAYDESGLVLSYPGIAVRTA